MFHVIACRKYTQQTIRLVNADSLDDMLKGDMGECLLCGPCSHVELGPRKDYWTVLSSHDDEDSATVAAWESHDGNPDKYSSTYLPKLVEASRT